MSTVFQKKLNNKVSSLATAQQYFYVDK